MVRASHPASRNLSRAAMPSTSGISRSSRITSGLRRWARLTTSEPSAASPTTSKSGWVLRTATRPSRSIGWSSATRIRILVSSSNSECLQRHRHLEAGTLPGDAPYLEGTAEHLRPLPHADEPVTISGHARSEEHTSELQSRQYLVCRLLLEK